MYGIPRTDVELLRCAPLVGIAMFPDAKDNMIAQDFGKYCLGTNMGKFMGKYQYICMSCVTKTASFPCELM